MSSESVSATPDFGVLADVFTGYATLRRQIREARMLSAESVIDGWVSWRREDRKLQRRFSDRFRPLTLISIRETDHSLLLGELLNSEGSHGQGRLFLISFLTRIGISEPAAGTWAVTVEAGRVDVLLRRQSPASVVIIENKPHDAIDQPNQLYRYWLQEIHQVHRHLDYDAPETRSRFKVLFLPSGKHRAPTRESLSKPARLKDDPSLPEKLPLPVEILPYARDLADWLEGTIELLPAENVRLRTFLRFYLENWRNT